MAHLNDPWNQNFPGFKAAYNAATLPESGFAIFRATDLQNLLNLGASYVTVYTYYTPAGGGALANRKTIAIATDNNGFRINNLNLPYIFPDHNCPPDCDSAPVGGLQDVANLRKAGSTS